MTLERRSKEDLLLLSRSWPTLAPSRKGMRYDYGQMFVQPHEVFLGGIQVFASARKEYTTLVYTLLGQDSAGQSDIDDVLAHAQQLSNLEDDWDDQGSQGYAKETLDRVAVVLRRFAELTRRRSGARLVAPSVNPAAEGSIDLFWESEGHRLLINIPEDPERAASFYGEASSGDTIGGVAPDLTRREDLLTWLPVDG